MIKAFLMQLQFLTRIPVPVKIKFDEKAFAKGVILSPVIGLVIGLILGCVYYLAGLMGKQIPAIIIVVLAEIIITGGLHLDGLADTFDGIFSNRPKERILEIMRDSRIGTNGTLSLILIIICKIGLLLSLNERYIVGYLFIMPVISRMNIAWTAGISSYARKKGMAGALIRYSGIKEAIISTAITVVLSAIFIRLVSIIAISVAILFGIFFTRYVEKKIGGITGDIIGAVIELTEVILLFILLICESILLFNY